MYKFGWNSRDLWKTKKENFRLIAGIFFISNSSKCIKNIQSYGMWECHSFWISSTTGFFTIIKIFQWFRFFSISFSFTLLLSPLLFFFYLSSLFWSTFSLIFPFWYSGFSGTFLSVLLFQFHIEIWVCFSSMSEYLRWFSTFYLLSDWLFHLQWKTGEIVWYTSKI